MNKTASLNRQFVAFAVPLLLLVGLVALIRFPLSQSNSDALGFGITVDLLLTVPLLYLVLIRKTSVPAATAVPLMFLGLLIGTCLLPEGNQNYLDLFKVWVLPIIELTILTFVVARVRQAIFRSRALGNTSLDFFEALKSTCRELLPKRLAIPSATEVAVIYYGFLNWKSKPIDEHEFTYHRKSGTVVLLTAVIFIVMVETFIFHILIVRWSETAAWIFSGLGIYTAIQVFGFARSMTKRPIAIGRSSLILRYGILSEAEIDFSDIDKIEMTTADLPKDKNIRRLSPLGELENHNVVIHLKKANILTGLYGIQRHFRVLALHVDSETEFKWKVDNALHAPRAEERT
jgi:hypothetical protein